MYHIYHICLYIWLKIYIEAHFQRISYISGAGCIFLIYMYIIYIYIYINVPYIPYMPVHMVENIYRGTFSKDFIYFGRRMHILNIYVYYIYIYISQCTIYHICLCTWLEIYIEAPLQRISYISGAGCIF